MRVPYFVFTVWIGKLSKVHMPSSALAGVAPTDRMALTAPRVAMQVVKRSERSDIGDKLPEERS